MHMINKMLYGVFVMQFLIIALFTTMSVIWQKNNAATAPYLGITGEITPKKIVI